MGRWCNSSADWPLRGLYVRSGTAPPTRRQDASCWNRERCESWRGGGAAGCAADIKTPKGSVGGVALQVRLRSREPRSLHSGRGAGWQVVNSSADWPLRGLYVRCGTHHPAADMSGQLKQQQPRRPARRRACGVRSRHKGPDDTQRDPGRRWATCLRRGRPRPGRTSRRSTPQVRLRGRRNPLTCPVRLDCPGPGAPERRQSNAAA